MEIRKSKPESNVQKDRFSQFKIWTQTNRWIAWVLIIGTIVIGLGKFTDAIEKIQHFVTGHSHSPPSTASPRPWRELRARALAAVDALEKRGLASNGTYASNFLSAASNLRASLQSDLRLQEFNAQKRSSIERISKEEQQETIRREIEMLNTKVVLKASFMTESFFRLTNYTQLSLELSETIEALSQISDHPDFPRSQHSLHTSYLKMIHKMARTCDLVVAAMRGVDNRDLNQRLRDLEENAIPPGGEVSVRALREYISSL